MTTPRFSRHLILYACAIGLVAFFVATLFPYASAFLSAVILYVLFNPLYIRLKKWGWASGWAAFLILNLTIVGIVVPISSLVMVIATHSDGMVTAASETVTQISQIEFPKQSAELLRALNIQESLSNWIRSGSTTIAQRLVALLGNIGHGLLVLFLMEVVLFYLLVQQDVIRRSLYRYWPSHPETIHMVGYQVRRVTISVIVSTALIAVVQSTIMGLSFWILDIPHVLLLSALTFVLSVVPFIGSPLVWGSVAVFKWLDHQSVVAMIIVIVGVFVSTIDNVLRPMFQRQYGELHPVTSLVGILVGVPVFGFIGLFIGPIAVVLLIEIVKLALIELRAEAAGKLETPYNLDSEH